MPKTPVTHLNPLYSMVEQRPPIRGSDSVTSTWYPWLARSAPVHIPPMPEPITRMS